MKRPGMGPMFEHFERDLAQPEDADVSLWSQRISTVGEWVARVAAYLLLSAVLVIVAGIVILGLLWVLLALLHLVEGMWP